MKGIEELTRTKNYELISIIVPIYNTEQYLRECVESILNQTYHNIEIILVDDGSKDNSGKICDEFATRDNRVKVIHKINGGLVSARKAGVENAQGAYVGFVDSDDWIDYDMYQQLIDYAVENDTDIVCSGCTDESPENKLLIADEVDGGLYKRGENYDRIIHNLIRPDGGEGYGITYNVWSKLYKKEILTAALAAVNDNVKIGEDLACIVKAFLLANRVFVTKKRFYHHRAHSNSMMNVKDAMFFTELNMTYNGIRNIIEEYEEYTHLLLPKLTSVISENILAGMNRNFDWGCNIRVDIERYRMPDDLWDMLSGRIVLCGAGKIGQVYHKELKHNTKCTVVAWLDSNASRYDSIWGVKSLEYIKESDYDMIVLGVKNQNVAEEIKQTLLQFGVSDDKIVWCEPENIIKVTVGGDEE